MPWRSNAHQVVAGTRSQLDPGSLERSARKGTKMTTWIRWFDDVGAGTHQR